MPTFEELRECYYQIIDSGEYQFLPPQDNSEIVNQIYWEVESVGQKAPDVTKHFEQVDQRELYLNIYRPLCNQVVLSYQYMGFDIPSVCVGAINDGSLNATVRSMFGEGAVVLVNAGLDNFYYQGFKVLANSCFADNPNYSRSKASSFIRGIVSASSHGDPRMTERLPLTEASYMMLALELHRSTERFIIAHELAHLTEEKVCCMSPVQLEFRADKLAMEVVLMLHSNELRKNPQGNARLRAMVAAIAPIVMFEFLFLKNVYHSILKGSNEIVYTEHPPELVRRDALIELIREKGVWEQFELVYIALTEVLSNAYRDMLDEIEDLTEFRRSMITFRCSYSDCGEVTPIPVDNISYA